MNNRFAFIILFTLALVSRYTELGRNGVVLGAEISPLANSVTEVSAQDKTQIKTTTAFAQKEITQNQAISFDTTYKKDPDTEYGQEKILQEGVAGNKVFHYLITFWGDEEIDRQLTKTDTTPPIEKIIAKGTKIVWRVLAGTEYGRLKYWSKMRVFATKYDGNCYGCSGRTFSGTPVVKGVCATDPKTIPLGTNFYVPNYGMCRAEDIGGLIKGDRIDLGFVDASKGNWGASYTDVYLLTNAPQ